MKTRLIAGVMAGALLFAACGSDDSSADSTTTTGASADPTESSSAPDGSTTTTAASTGALASVAETSLGETLVDEDGLTLYGFTPDGDAGGEPTCLDACEGAWPPVVIPDGELPADLDPDVFSVVERPDGSSQLKAGDWPLYRFSGDAVAGDVTGQGSGDVWFAAAPDGTLIKDAA